MSDESNQSQDPQPEQFVQRPAASDEKAIREGAWHVIQQGAEVYGALGGGTVGFAGGAKLLKDTFGGGKSGGDQPSPPQGSGSDQGHGGAES